MPRMWEEPPTTLLEGYDQQDLLKHGRECCSSGTYYAGTRLPSCSIPLDYEAKGQVANSNVPALHATWYCHDGPSQPHNPGILQITYRAAITPPFWLDRRINPMIETCTIDTIPPRVEGGAAAVSQSRGRRDERMIVVLSKILCEIRPKARQS
ncbi:hypothetical protein BO99DRAFT_406675 [Aspergillus violaceofuscus CBS 115571]|uniref:Uncharacterized protein n=1 Tax=Aspergillus violaceofuscus (strain CBS 115571) TaxID=1450538 RepID=A0A2V5GSY0_ASPV1|nr:hypothetical protein BO99DRAFT_406675 [Aspergillus violaceofuscus CBS 115571]